MDQAVFWRVFHTLHTLLCSFYYKLPTAYRFNVPIHSQKPLLVTFKSYARPRFCVLTVSARLKLLSTYVFHILRSYFTQRSLL